jgi:regulator of sirC expression with transglutaminase-like and TPR domain
VTLASLLGDESEVVQREVRRELLRRGKMALALLRKIERSGEPRTRARARALLLRKAREGVVRRMIAFACGKTIELERGLLLMSRYEEPGLDLRPYVLAIDAMAAEIRKRLDARPALDAHAEILCRYLGRELGYRGDRGDYHHPDNVYLHRAIVRRRGLPLTLTALYLLVAKRSGIRAAPVALPGHVVLRVHEPGGRRVLVDPFARGRVLSERDCLEHLAKAGLPFQPRQLDDASDADLWVRHLNNLVNSYRLRGLAAEVRELELLIRVAARRKGERP